MIATLFENPSFRVFDYHCEAHERCVGPEEEADRYELVFPRRGVFVHHVRGESFVADPGGAIFFNRGESYRVSHPVGGGDRCTALSFSRSRAVDCLTALDPRAADAGEQLFTRAHCMTTPSVDLLHRRLLRAVRSDCDALALEEIGLELLAWTVAHSSKAVDARRAPRRSSTRDDHDELVRAVKLELSLRLDRKLQLDALARAVHASPFHLSRVFRARTGSSLSDYHRRLRLRVGLERILDGEDDLTGLALDLGFAHHSHFSSAFQREFGITPSSSRDRKGLVALRRAASRLA